MHGETPDIYRKSLSEKDLSPLSVPAGPEAVVDEISKRQKRQSKSRYAKVATGVWGGLVRLHRFSASIDMLAQGSPSPVCLLWGSIKFVLTVGDIFRYLLDWEACFDGTV